jgi:5-methylcytosine-specific restriction enzyme A
VPRPTKPWAGKTDSSKVPLRVRQRVYDKHKGKCWICKLPINGKPWEIDHVQALINGGRNEESNLAPAHVPCHRDKTKKDVKQKAKTAKIRGRHTGAIQAKGQIKGKGFAKGTQGKRLTSKEFLIP